MGFRGGPATCMGCTTQYVVLAAVWHAYWHDAHTHIDLLHKRGGALGFRAQDLRIDDSAADPPQWGGGNAALCVCVCVCACVR